MENNRISNFELARIFAMIMIISSHYAGHGIVHLLYDDAYIYWNTGSSINKFITCLMMPGAQIGTAIFFVISGYFGILLRIKSVSRLLYATLFYGGVGIIICLIDKLLDGALLGMPNSSIFSFSVKSIFNPLSGGNWWFITAYVLLLLVSPLINEYLHKLTTKGIIILLLFLWIFEYGIGSLGADFYNFNKAVFFYAVGFAIKNIKSSIFNNKLLNRTLFTILWVCGTLLYYAEFTLQSSQNSGSFSKMVIMGIELLNIVLVTPLCTICFVKNIEKISLRSSQINKIASCILGVFLFHDSIIIRKCLWNPILRVDEFYRTAYFPIIAFTEIATVLLIGLLIETMRKKIFWKFEHQLDAKIENKIKNLIN